MLRLSICEVLKQLRSGAISSKELCMKCAARAKKVEDLNAFITTTYDQAEEEAATVHDQDNTILLHGIPFAVKDNFSTAGIKTTCASNMLKDYVPPYTATVVQRLQDEGGILCGKTNLDEFAMGSGTVDSIYGPSRNPWKYPFLTDKSEVKDSDWFVAGGSSGGSAVAVATGAVFGALGSDTGGSVRLPASNCGVVGLKCSYGMLSRHGLIPLVNSLDVPGVIAKTVDDIALMLSAIVGPDPFDATCISTKESFMLPEEVSVKGLTIGIPKEYFAPGLSEDMHSAWSKAADIFENGGAIVKQVSLPHSQHSVACYSVLCAAEVASNMSCYDGIEYGLRKDIKTSTEALYAANRHEGFNDIVRGRIFAGNYFLLRRNYQEFYMHAQKVRRLIAQDFEKVYESGIDILLTPTTLQDAHSYAEFRSVDSRAQSEYIDVLSHPANFAGIPAISLPATLSKRGLPIGLQLIGQFFQDKKMLMVAKWLEQQLNFPHHILQDELDQLDER